MLRAIFLFMIIIFVILLTGVIFGDKMGYAILFILILGVTLRIVLNYHAWKKLSEQLGLTFSGLSSPFSTASVTGLYCGHKILLSTYRRGGASRYSDIYTLVEVKINNAQNIHLFISNPSIIGIFSKQIGVKDIHTGIDKIDRRFSIRGEPEEKVIELINKTGISENILSVTFDHINITHEQIRYEKMGIERNIDKIIKVFDLLCMMADGVEHI